MVQVNRREFIKYTASVGIGVSPVVGSFRSLASTALFTSHPGYIREKIPSVPYPPHRGSWNDDQVPDTLDLAEMARLLVNGLTGPNDPRADYEQYFGPNLGSNPAVMGHDWSDQCQMRSMKALPLMRHISGSDFNHQIDQIWLDVVLKSIGPDGLYYMPTKGRPWAHRYVESIPDGIYTAEGTSVSPDDQSVEHYMYSFHPGYAISTMMIYYLRDRNPIWKSQIEAMIDGLSRLAIRKENYCFLPAAEFEPNAKVPATANMPTGQLAVNSSTWLLDGLGKYYEMTGYTEARDLGRKLVNYLLDRAEFFDQNGGCFDRSNDFLANHFHSHTVSLVVMLDLAAATHNHDLIQFVKRQYECFRAKGDTLTGFFPESAIPDYPSCETCEIADMIALSLKLSSLEAGDYWDDADRWLRNQFAENQLTPEKCNDIKGLGEKLGLRLRHADGFFSTDDRVAERNVGAFAGWASANEWFDDEMRRKERGGIMHCCTGNAAQTVFYLWKRTLETSEDQMRLNLLLNHASPEADVYSHIPFEGRVDLRIKKPSKNLLVRMPEWVDPQSDGVSSAVNSHHRKLDWAGRFASVGEVHQGDRVSVRFPVYEKTVTHHRIGNQTYSLVIKGNTVISIDPAGEQCPMYRRRRYRANTAPLRSVRRFLADENIAW